ncbi:unnamed protein product [Blepharisma stoltei]|uniref:ABC transporter domain-containing protein n=1 Tax=Blepharisma stoltei TaxID=1481888 RepID=A0AAU9JRK8_9CILI|nr:unnamed protein product [Blepharisma stoltei]
MSTWQHYRALLYKNWILWKRRLCGSLCEFLFPIALLIMLAIIREAVGYTKHGIKSYLVDEEWGMTLSTNNVNYFGTYFEPAVKFTDYPKNFSSNYYRLYDDKKEKGKWYISFVNEAKNDFTKYLIQNLTNWVNSINPNLQYNVTNFNSENDLEDYIKKSDYGENDGDHPMKIFFAVVFYKTNDFHNVKYSFRTNVTFAYPSGDRRVGDNIEIFDFQKYSATETLLRKPMPKFQSQFFGTNFIHIMNYIDNHIIKYYSGSQNPYIAAGFVPMYYDEYVSDDFITLIANTLPFFLIISYLVPVCRMISLIVQEKEYKIKEMMMIMGLSNKAYWLSWITYYFSVYTLIAAVGAIISTKLFKYSNIGVMFVSYWLYGMSCLAFSVFISTFFSKSRSAVMLGLMAFLISYFISFAVTDPTLDQSSKTAASLLPNVALALGCDVLSKFEDGQAGVQPDNTSSVINNYTYGTFLAFMVIDTVIFTILAVYLDIVWPTEWGVKRPWYFLFTKSFWCSNKKNAHEELFSEEIKWADNVEPGDDNLEIQKENGQALLIRKFKKDFGSKTVVENLSLDIYNGQIFALLGHNGAGKTTTISMMCGLIPTSYGDMKINNLYLSTDLAKIRRSLGVCPQHNVLYNDLTPEEHLYLFSVFKGMKDKKIIKEQIKEKLTEVDLISKKNRLSKFLSGGMKRKLSLAIALIADSPIVLLDEPTSGMDLTARRQMWDMLKNNKANRIIILTTHYMEEADVLADRIAIMSHGSLRCLGSSLFLKKRYGVGYYLTIVKEVGIASKSHTQKVTDFIQSYIPDATAMSDVHAEISFQIPSSSSDKFTTFFADLDANLKDLQLRSYGVSVTTLEEVFLRVARGDDGEINKDKEKDKEKDENVELENDFVLSRDRLKGSLFFIHFLTLLKKRIYWTKRDFKSLVYEIFIPIVMVIVGLGLMMIATRFPTPTKHKLTVDSYSDPQYPLYDWPDSVSAEIKGDWKNYKNTENANNNSLTGFDWYLFETRDDPNHYRMGSYYFNRMDDDARQYEFIVFHNQSAFQATAVWYNNMSNEILGKLSTPWTVTVYNYPLPYTKKVLGLGATGDGFIASIIFSLGYSFIPTGIVALVVKERENNVKHQHMISGVSRFSYWCANFVWDSVKHLVPAIVSALMVLAFGVEILTDPSDNYGAVWILMLLYGISIAPFTYFTSFFFKNYPTAQIMTILFNVVAGGIFPAVILILYIFDTTREIGRVLRWIFRLFPAFSFGNGLMDIGSVSLYSTLDDAGYTYNVFEIESAGADMLMIGVMIPVYLFLVYVQEYLETHPKLLQKFWKTPHVAPTAYEMDDDVEKEAKAANTISPKDAQVNVRGVRKVYRQGLGAAFAAVEDVSFSVNEQECFAFLGVNGAGKTTTFKMLTGEIAPTEGEAFICGHSVVKDLERARDLIGYCPQFDAISELLTAREHLRLYSDIKGIPKDRKEALVEEMLDQMDLRQYADQQAGTYSGGNKRKLSVAMALIGNPTVVFLDEPSAGMDPETRKKMWKVIGNLKRKNSSVILTTHSMEEAEALSDRMTIMVAGRLRCLGTATWIKSKYGDRYEFEAKVQVPSHFEVTDRGTILDRLLMGEQTIKNDQIQQCLELLNASSFFNEIQEKGAGSSLFQQLKNDGTVQRDSLVSWVIIEEMGDKIYEWLKSEFSKVEIMEHFSSLFKFKIAKENEKSIGYLFSAVETNKEVLKISEYALSQSSLEQIFNDFARKGEAEQAGVVRRYQE